ncbi:bacteriohemerythrin [Roseburia sp. MSJ-14]|uniref:bacteriohemerythrin n=1 Tax=Roseburia sp. MSJ-14 TaxID=2841514 RepID=UPI001C1150C8|nr:bacteriohemerythrin [Roseburia sp. MSJ-14]MBU5474702.1 bacteriohemerythrin [Roseburia sp. MSJ-14]
MYRFTEDCLIGIDQIDEEHRHLFELINAVMDLLHNDAIADKYHQLNALLDDLKEYADTHFEHEEAYMESIQDPELAVQKQQHQEFREKIDSLDIQSKDSEEEQKEMLEEMMMYLTKWLYHHILGSDIMIGKLHSIQENPSVFDEKYYTGIEFIDEEHRRLFEIIEEANQLIKAELLHDKYDEIVRILGELKEYTQEHFKDEEEYMERIGYSGLEAQKRAHEAFVEKLTEINLEEVDERQQEYLEELMEFLLGWLINHILKADKKIGEESKKEC